MPAKVISSMSRIGRVFLVSLSHIPDILGTQASGNANFVQECGNAEHKRIGTIILCSSEEIKNISTPPPTQLHDTELTARGDALVVSILCMLQPGYNEKEGRKWVWGLADPFP